MGRIDVGGQAQGAPSASPLNFQQQQYYGAQPGDPGYYGAASGQQDQYGPSPPGSSHGSDPYYGQGGAFPPQGGPPPFPHHQQQQEHYGPSPPGSSHGYPGSNPAYGQGGAFPPQGGPPTFPQQQQEHYGPSPPGSSHGYPGSNPAYGQGGAFPPQGGRPPTPPLSPRPQQTYQQQPQQQQSFYVQTPTGFLQTQPWSTGLLDCFEDPSSCVITALAPCVTYGQITEVLDQGTTSCFNGGLLYTVILCCLGVPCLLSYTARAKLRFKFGLPEDPMTDCLTHCLCEACALCQEYRELKNRGMDPVLGWAGVNTKLAMAAPRQPAMVR